MSIYNFIKDELEQLSNKASTFKTRAAAISDEFSKKNVASEQLPNNLFQALASQEYNYDTFLKTLERYVNSAQAELRYLQDTLTKKDLEEEEKNAYVLTKALIEKAVEYSSSPYPSHELLRTIHTVSATLDAREKSADASISSLQNVLEYWEKEASILESMTKQKIEDASNDSEIENHLLDSLKGLAETTILKPVNSARNSLLELQQSCQSVADEARSAAHSFRPIASSAEQRDATIKHLSSEANAALDHLAEITNSADRNMRSTAQQLRDQSLINGYPIVGNLRPIVSIFEIKPPPIIPNTLNTSQRQQIYAHAFSAILNERPAIQILHLFHPFCEISRLVVLGDDFDELCESVTLCASTHVRAGRKVTVFMPSAGTLELLERARYDELYDVNLQQLITGMNKKLSGRRSELKLLHAEYQIKIIGNNNSNEDVAAINETHLYLAVQPRYLPKIAHSKGMTMVAALEAAPHGAPDEALITIGLPKPKSRLTFPLPPLFNAQYSRSLSVFIVSPRRFKRTPSIRSVNVRADRSQNLLAMSSKTADDFINELVPIKNAKILTEIAQLAPVLQLLSQLVRENERAVNSVGGVIGAYCGSDLEGQGHFTKLVTNIFRDLFDYSDPFVPKKSKYSDRRAVAACSSLAEWKRLTALKKSVGDEVRIIVFGKVGGDPAFDAAVRGKIGVLHIFLPMSDAEQTRVIRRFLPASVLVYNWGKVLIERLVDLLPGPIVLTNEIVQLAKKVAINANVFPRAT